MEQSPSDSQFLKLLAEMNLIRVNRQNFRENGADAGSTNDLFGIQFLLNDDADYGKLIKFMRNNPDKAKNTLIRRGGYAENNWFNRTKVRIERISEEIKARCVKQ